MKQALVRRGEYLLHELDKSAAGACRTRLNPMRRKQLTHTSQRHQVFALITLVLCTLACSKTSTPSLPPLAEDAKILAFGDSLTSGSGSSRGKDYPAQLAQMIQRSVVNAGIPGETSAQGVRRLPALLDKYQPDLVILIHGGNDFLRKLDTRHTRENLVTMIQMLDDANVSTVFLGVPQPALWLQSADLYADLAKQWNLPFDEDVLSEILSDRDLKSDQIHPNDHGYHMLAKAVHRLLQASGAL